jgi:2-polyprenyl-6-methoxyphenol hydroxylase-like FAD-dependent oxidoreductase
MPTTPTTDVLIVGAGPTGTALAIDLTRRGVAVRLVDKEHAAFDGSRAKGVQPRTLEVLEDLGALRDVLDWGSLYPKMGIHLGPLTIPRQMIEKGEPGPDVPYPDTWLIPQNSTVRALHERLESLGTPVELGAELLDFTIDAPGVTAQLNTLRGPEEITARYLVGADGGSSRVRKTAGIQFSGSTDEADRMLIVDAAVDGGLSRKYWHVWPRAGGRFTAACPLPDSELFQWMIRLAPGEEPPTTAAEITKTVRSRTGNKKLTLRDIAWQSVFRPNIRLAEQYRRGPILIAGDAAHVHTPAGAQGLNTGIGDAYNLGWKLAQVLAGAPDALLDTYETERQPIAAAVLGLSTKKYQGIGTLDRESARRGKDEKQLTLTYYGGPLAPSTADHTTTLRVGDRSPDAELLDGDGVRQRLFKAFVGPHFTAIGYGSGGVAQLRKVCWPDTGAPLNRLLVDASEIGSTDADTVLTDPKGDFARIYGLTADAVLLIRPDGYIGHIATHDMASTTCSVINAMTP